MTVLFALAVMTIVLGVEVAMFGMIQTRQMWMTTLNDADTEVFLEALVGNSENDDITLAVLNPGCYWTT